VIINAHKFGSRFAVNGKQPVSVWIPSLDPANGTTTLNDLVGTNNGTLQTFALTGTTSNWVTDTGAGGSVALAYDPTSDQVLLSTNPLVNSTAFSVSLWFKLNGVVAQNRGLFGGWNSSLTSTMLFRVNSSNALQWYVSSSTQVQTGGTFSTGLIASQWYNVSASYDGSTMRCFINGTASATTFSLSGAINPSASVPVYIGGGGASQGYTDGRIDDCRLFYTGLDLADAQYLWNSGNGRARVT
jgi:hypothetical protein